MRLNSPVGVSHNIDDPAHSRPKREVTPDPEPVVAPACDTGVSRTDLNRQPPTVRKGTRQTGNLRF